jgi:hypothetical protein
MEMFTKLRGGIGFGLVSIVVVSVVVGLAAVVGKLFVVSNGELAAVVGELFVVSDGELTAVVGELLVESEGELAAVVGELLVESDIDIGLVRGDVLEESASRKHKCISVQMVTARPPVNIAIPNDNITVSA